MTTENIDEKGLTYSVTVEPFTIPEWPVGRRYYRVSIVSNGQEVRPAAVDLKLGSNEFEKEATANMAARRATQYLKAAGYQVK